MEFPRTSPCVIKPLAFAQKEKGGALACSTQGCWIFQQAHLFLTSYATVYYAYDRTHTLTLNYLKSIYHPLIPKGFNDGMKV